jgi:uncharacterized protein (TIGR00645 family)
MSTNWTRRAGNLIFAVRWILYPLSLALIVALSFYVIVFLSTEYVFMRHIAEHWELESLMVMLLGFVDALMVANLIVMVVQGSYRIFIHKFDIADKQSRPQWLDHIDSGILKVKIALSIAGITLVQILRDFVHVEQVNWTTTEHRIVIHIIALFSALMMAVIWRVTHPEWAADKNHAEEDESLTSLTEGSWYEKI